MVRGGKRPGAGRKAAGKAKRVPVLVRIPPTARDALQRAADKAGRSLSAESEQRLVDSLAFQGAIDNFVRYFGGQPQFAVLAAVANLMKSAERFSKDETWLDDPYRFDVAVRLALMFLEHFRPEGPIVRPPQGFLGDARLGSDDQVLLGMVLGAVDGIANAPDEDYVTGVPNERGGETYYSEQMLNQPRIKRWLGKYADRLKRPAPTTPKGRAKK